MKGVAIDAIFLIVVIGMLIGASLLIYAIWVENQKNVATEISCKLKIQVYCNKLVAGENPKWDELEPREGCEKYGIEAPPTLEECKSQGLT